MRRDHARRCRLRDRLLQEASRRNRPEAVHIVTPGRSEGVASARGHRVHLDECATALRPTLAAHGHDVTRARDVLPGGSSDPRQMAFAVADGRIMVTLNRQDFLLVHETWLLAGAHHFGVVSCLGQVPDFDLALASLLGSAAPGSRDDRMLIWEPVARRWVVAGA
ncbi:MAG: DUF5615 family PIN-like protein [Dehalococcoidia bacterium]